eukprot:4262910-Amphidinium_carterae.1
MGWVGVTWFGAVGLGFEDLPGPVAQRSSKATPHMLVAAEPEKATGGFSGLDDGKQFALIGCA